MTESLVVKLPPGPWPPGPSAPELHPDQVHVWFSDLSEIELPKNVALPISSEETQRVRRFRREEDRRVWLKGRVWLRTVLSRYSDLEPHRIQFRVGENGKPSVKGLDGRLEFNLSHSGEHALVGVSMAEVGVDLEQLGAVQVSSDLLQDVFSEYDTEVLEGLERHERDHVFLLGWTRKEALVKGTGEGLSRPLRSLTVLRRDVPKNGSVPFRVTGSQASFRGWTLWDLKPTPSLFGAVAVKVLNPTFEAWSWI